MDNIIMKWLDIARIDIKNKGEGNNVKVMVGEGICCNITHSQCFSKDGIGYVLETGDKHVLLDLECLGEGNLVICLRGIDRWFMGGPKLPLWVDYTRLAINKNVIFWELKPLRHDREYYFTKQVTDGESKCRDFLGTSWV